MSASHYCNLTIRNNTGSTLSFDMAHFDQTDAGLASGQAWPTTIENGANAYVTCCSSSSFHGCSGYTVYNLGTANETPLYFYFGNPFGGVDNNTASFGAQGSSCISSNSSSKPETYPVFTSCEIGNSSQFVTCETLYTNGGTNNCAWNIQTQDLSIQSSNIQIKNVEAVFAAIQPAAQERVYFQCSNPPVSGAAYGWSHFKGLGFLGNRMVLTHSNIDELEPAQSNGWILYADNPLTVTSTPFPSGSSNQPCAITATLPSQHPGWPHPCSLQVCGTFLAMGIQSSVSASTSLIQFFDARNALINQPMVPLPVTISRDNGTNGVGMTQAQNGNYIVAVVNSQDLDVYVSDKTSLLSAGIAFNSVLSISNFDQSGAGVALLTKQDGGIFLVAMNGINNGGNNRLQLYQLTNLQGSVSKSQGAKCTSLTAKSLVNPVPMPIDSLSDSVNYTNDVLDEALLRLADPIGANVLGGLVLAEGTDGVLNSSFRWGKGLNIVSENSIQVYASDRTVIPWSHLNSSKVDFSVLVWTATASSS